MVLYGGCGPVHKPLTNHAGAQRSFPFGDNAASGTAEQMGNIIKAALLCASSVAPPSGHFMNHKSRVKTISSPHNLPHKW